MSDWWTYRLSDFLLFSPDTYRRLFELYNAAIWPIQIAAALLGLLALAGAWRRTPREAAVLAILALCWAWVGWAFHLGHYQTINWAAIGFAGTFGVQALLLAWAALATPAETAAGKNPGRRLRRGMGLSLCLLAVLGLPALDLLLGRPVAQAAVFGVTPDPTAIATLGLLLMMRGGRRAALWPIPLAWCAISGATLWAMNAPEALLPPAAGTAALAVRLIGARASMRRSRLAREHGEGR
jgi:hypothetical protein